MSKKATFGAGCFWGVEEAFRKVDGVIHTTVGYSGGKTDRPSYEQVCSGDTGHAEVCEVEYDPAKVKFEDLLTVFWEIHDPTQVNRQGPDVGTQYRTVVFYHDDEQKKTVEQSKAQLEASGKFDRPVATAIEPVAEFYSAEDYHQKYLQRRGGH